MLYSKLLSHNIGFKSYIKHIPPRATFFYKNSHVCVTLNPTYVLH
jgi:hypothetical protein